MGLDSTKTSHPHLFSAGTDCVWPGVSGRVPRDSMPCKIMSVIEWMGRLNADLQEYLTS